MLVKKLAEKCGEKKGIRITGAITYLWRHDRRVGFADKKKGFCGGHLQALELAAHGKATQGASATSLRC